MSEKQSKFAGILRSRQAESPEVEEQTPPEDKKPESIPNVIKAAPAKRPRGRPGGQGKRLNPDYAQVTAYIPAELHTQTKINLLRQSKKLEFSELVEELLTAWNRKQSQGALG